MAGLSKLWPCHYWELNFPDSLELLTEQDVLGMM